MASAREAVDPKVLAREQGSDGLIDLLVRNQTWANAQKLADPEYFHRLLPGQKPPYFLIGCVDSRVLCEHLFNLEPGQILVHRNVANQTRETDASFQTSLQFAVEELHVQHIIVKGHYSCGGVAAAMGPERADSIGEWVEPIRHICATHQQEMQASTDPAKTLSELNVLAQVQALSRNPVVRRAWADGASLTIHGWAYGIGDGLVRPVCAPVKGPEA